VRVVAVGEAGHASTPDVGTNAVPLLGELLRRIGRGMPTPQESPHVDAMLSVLLGSWSDRSTALAQAAALHPVLAHDVPALAGTTMAPTLLTGSSKRNVMPSRASVELDCRILPGTSAADVERAVRARLGTDLPYELEWPEQLVAGSASSPETALMDAMSRVLATSGDDAELLPLLCTGFTDSVYLRAAGTPTAYGFSPFRATSAEVMSAGFHNADERVHTDDLLLAVEFHVALAREVLG
jgi:acetylornithine deacetylase/succinyl-diaminopimelate desuccinylase-like protein